MVKILHAADLHLDSAFVGLSPEAARARRAGQRKLLETIVEKANELQVDILMLAGDILDGKNAYYATAAALSGSLSKCNAKVFLVAGNHDPFDAASPYRTVRFPSNVHFFQSEQIKNVELPELDCVVYGASFLDSACEAPLLSGFSVPNDGKLHVMVLHGECTEGASKNNPIRKQDLEASGLHYVALGHIHKRSELMRAGNTVYAYPGCPEGRGFDECGEKGVLFVTVSRETVNAEFIPLEGFRYEQTELSVESTEDAREKLANILAEEDEKLNLRVILVGTSETIDLSSLQTEFSARVGRLVLVDHTTPLRSPWEGEDAENLKGAFLRKLHMAYNAADAEEQNLILQAVKYGVAALENREEA
ncbi:MAG: DNA repair exonuclease [Ruminococcaceae bacterium]|nr:DNA repair exonuclease [Oscillospiraceae bacterium]